MIGPQHWRERIVNSTHVVAGVYDDPVFLVDGVIPDAGLVVLTGGKGTGKTFALLSMAAGIAAGGRALGRLRCEKRPVLFLELELSERILNRRMNRMELYETESLDLAFSWRPGAAGIADLHEAIEDASYKCIVIDVLQRFWPPDLDPNSYQDSYELLGKLRELANYHDITIVLATHSGKAERADIMHSTIGSVGVQANSDVQLFIDRTRGSDSAVLKVFGNDIESCELAMRFDAPTLTWIVTDEDPREASQSPERREILDLLRESGPMKSGAIAEAIGKGFNATSYLLKRLHEEGLIYKPGYGLYTSAKTTTGSTGSTGSENEESTEDTVLTVLPVHGQPQQEKLIDDIEFF